MGFLTKIRNNRIKKRKEKEKNKQLVINGFKKIVQQKPMPISEIKNQLIENKIAKDPKHADKLIKQMFKGGAFKTKKNIIINPIYDYNEHSGFFLVQKEKGKYIIKREKWDYQ